MRVFLCVALLCAVGCSSVPAMAPDEHSDKGLQYWIPNVAKDMWDTFDANIGFDYGFGAHVKATDLLRLGIFDYADFSLLGLDSSIFQGEWHHIEPTRDVTWDLSAKVGVGLGASAALHTWEVVDLVSSIIGLGYWSLDQD